MGWVQRNISRIILSLAAGAIIFVAAFAIYKGLETQWSYEQQPAKSAQTAGDHARIQVQRYCVPLPPNEENDCRREIEDSYRDYYKEARDLEAQRTTAMWTAFMGAAALLGMAISIIGVGLVYITFGETRAANIISQEAQRAWVKLGAVPRLIRASGIEGLYVRVDFSAENTGQSAATHFCLYHKIFFRPYGEAGDDLSNEMKAQVEVWRSEHNAPAKASLLPNDKEISGDWKSFKSEEIQWKEKIFVGPVAQPMLLAATIYRTTFAPHTLQVSWRTWYLVTLDEDDQIVSHVPQLTKQTERLGSHDLCLEPFHMAMTHAEYPVAGRKKQDDSEQAQEA